MDKERIMLIVWKWRDLERNKCIANQELLQTPAYQDVYKNIELAYGKLYNEYGVYEQQPDGRTELHTPISRVIRTFIAKSIHSGKESNECSKYLDALVDHYSNDNTELMVFLHRRDGFTQTDVEALSKKYNLKGCFLIGDGRDNIYYRPQRKQGMLGDNGYFYSAPPEPTKGQPAVKVADNKKRIVYARYFDNVWNYYQHEFYTKIFEFKEDLLSYFYQLLPDRKPVTVNVLCEHLKKNRELELRTASFIDDNFYCLPPHELKELDVIGKEAAKAYEFDDLKANLQMHQNITAEYNNVSELLHDTLFHTNNKQLPSINHWMRDVDNLFTILLAALKRVKN